MQYQGQIQDFQIEGAQKIIIMTLCVQVSSGAQSHKFYNRGPRPEA